MANKITTKKFTHKYKQAVTSKFVVTLVDKRGQYPDSTPNVEVTSGDIKTANLNMSVEEAKELAAALRSATARFARKEVRDGE